MIKSLSILLLTFLAVTCADNNTKEETKTKEDKIEHNNSNRVSGKGFGYRQKDTGVILDMFDTDRDFKNEEPVYY